MQRVLAWARKLPLFERRVLLMALALISAIGSNFLPFDSFKLFEVPLPPALYFGLVLGVAILVSSERSLFEAAFVLIICVIAWIAAVRTTIAVFTYVQDILKEAKTPGSLDLGPANVAYLLAVCGAIGGLVGSGVIAIGLSLSTTEFRAFDKWGRTIVAGTAAGLLLECDGPAASAKLPIHFGSLLPLFVAWQVGVAATVAFGLESKARRAAASRQGHRARARKPSRR